MSPNGERGGARGHCHVEIRTPSPRPSPLWGYGSREFDSVISAAVACCQESVREDFPIPARLAVVIHWPRRWLEAAMMAQEPVGVGYFGDVRREQAGAILLERVVATGSLVLRKVGGDR